MDKNKKTYLGDGVYGRYDGYHIVLTTENGISVQNEIALESQVIESLFSYIERVFNVQIKVTKKKEEAEDEQQFQNA